MKILSFLHMFLIYRHSKFQMLDYIFVRDIMVKKL